MSDPQTKLANFQRALDRLNQGIAKLDASDDLARDGLIQRFEFTFELAWKTLQNCFEDEGLTGLNSPKTVLREAYAARLIEDEELWLAMLQDRNSTAHIYSEQLARQICEKIRTRYSAALASLLAAIQSRLHQF